MTRPITVYNNLQVHFTLNCRQKLNQVLDSMNSGVSKHLGQIADSMYEWEGKLADELGLTRADVATIVKKHPTDLKLQT